MTLFAVLLIDSTHGAAPDAGRGMNLLRTDASKVEVF
jgi:hypothetical protein